MKPLLGEYYPAASFWHTVDPRAKLFLTAGFTIPLFIVQGWELVALGAGFLLVWLTSRLPWQLYWQALWTFRWLLGLSVALNLFIPLHPLAISGERLLSAGELLGRLALFFGCAAWFSHTTLPAKIMEALEKIFLPFARLGAASADWAFMIMLSLRFLPELLADWEWINLIQQQRSGNNTNCMARFDRLRSLVVPAFTMSFRRAAAISIALVARGYRPGAPRSSREPLTLRAADFGVFVLAFIILAFFVISSFW
jgi:energy-coupling factor transport system permease protein